jgi:hypothetical protein
VITDKLQAGDARRGYIYTVSDLGPPSSVVLDSQIHSLSSLWAVAQLGPSHYLKLTLTSSAKTCKYRTNTENYELYRPLQVTSVPDSLCIVPGVPERTNQCCVTSADLGV